MGVLDKYTKKKKKKPTKAEFERSYENVGRKKKEMTDKQKEAFLDYTAAGASIDSLAPLFNMSDCTLRKYIRSEMGVDTDDFPLDTLENQVVKARSMGKEDLRMAQMNNAMGGNATMQIYLGKQLLRQTDNPDLREEKEKQKELYPKIKDLSVEDQIKHFLSKGLPIPDGLKMLYEIAKLRGEFGTEGGLDELKGLSIDELEAIAKG